MQFDDVMARVEFPGVEFKLDVSTGVPWMQASADGQDAVTGEPMNIKGRKWMLSFYMTDGEVVQTAFMAVKALYEHEIRECFHYRGRPVFGPHFDIEQLTEVAEKRRTEPT